MNPSPYLFLSGNAPEDDETNQKFHDILNWTKKN